MFNRLPRSDDGFLSSNREIHAFGIGIYEGFKDFADFDGLDKKAEENPDVRAEIHYAKGGYLLGAVIRVIIYIILTVLIVNGGL